MTPTSFAIILYGSVLVNLVLGLVVILIVGSYQRLLKSINSIARSEAIDKGKKVSLAKKESEEIITNALKKSKKILAESEFFTNDIKKDIAVDLKDILTDSATQAVEEIKQDLANKIEAQFMAEKDTKLEVAEEKIKKIAASSTKEILGKSIDPQDHEQLIKNSLEAVKKEGMF